MKKGKETVEILNFKTNDPEEFKNIICQKFTTIEQVEQIEKEFNADFRAYRLGQLIITRGKFRHGISVIPIPGEKWEFLELVLRGHMQLKYRGKDIYVDHNSPHLIASNEPIYYKMQKNIIHTTIAIDKQMLTAYAQKLVNGRQERKFTFHPQLLWTTPEAASFRRYLEFISQDLFQKKKLI